MQTSTDYRTTEPVSITPLPSLTERVQLVEKEIADLYRHVKQVRAAFDQAVAQATLRSREQTAEILQASSAQVHRWTASRQLRVVELDRRPRYRLQDIEDFVAAGLRGYRPQRSAKCITAGSVQATDGFKQPSPDANRTRRNRQN